MVIDVLPASKLWSLRLHRDLLLSREGEQDRGYQKTRARARRGTARRASRSLYTEHDALVAAVGGYTFARSLIADIINPLSKTPTRQSGRRFSGRPLRGLQRKVRNLASESAGRSANKNNTVPGATYCKPCTSYTLSYTLECKLRKSLKPIIRSALPGKRRDSAPQRVPNPYSMSQEEPDSSNNKKCAALRGVRPAATAETLLAQKTTNTALLREISPSTKYSGPYHSNQNPRWTQKPCIPLCLHTVLGSDYCVPFRVIR